MNTPISKERKVGGYEINRIVREALENGVEILPPCVNESNINFSVKNNKIIWGLSNIKNIANAAKELVKYQPYESLDGLLKSVNKRTVNKRVIDSLKFSGALDSIYKNDLTMEKQREYELEYLNVNLKHRKDINSKYKSLFNVIRSGIYCGTLISINEKETKYKEKMAFLYFLELDEKIVCWPKQYSILKSTLKSNIWNTLELDISKKENDLFLNKIVKVN